MLVTCRALGEFGRMSRIHGPDERGADGADSTTVSLAPARFPYRCVFIPKRARNKRAAYLTGECFVNVRRLNVRESAHLVAFRVHFPFRFTRNYALSETTLEILSFEDRLWWPLTHDFNPEIYPHTGIEPGAFLRGLEGETDFFGLDHVLDLAATKRILSTSRIEREDQDQVAARLQRAVAERILFVGNAVYALGGEPVYVQRKLPRKLHGNQKDITVASIYPDRAVGRRSVLRLHPGYMEFVDEYLERGAFHLGNEVSLARASAALIGMPRDEMPTIEVFMPDAIRQSRDDIRTDSLFRFALDRPRPWLEENFRANAVSDAVNILKSLAVTRPDSATTEDRFWALAELKRAIQADAGRLKDSPDFRYLVRNLKQVALSTRLDGDALGPMDEEALAGLA